MPRLRAFQQETVTPPTEILLMVSHSVFRANVLMIVFGGGGEYK